MRSRRPGRARARRLAGLLALAGPALAGTVAGAAPGAGTAGGTTAGMALTSLALVSAGSDGQAADAPSTQADVSAGGRYVAFQSRAALQVSASVIGRPGSLPYGQAATSRLYVRDLVNRTTTLLSNPADGDATAPSISANGRLVSYEQGGNVQVADRQATGAGAFDTARNLVVRQVTGTANDLAYEHVVPCPAGLSGAGARATPCGPRLSADGTTLVYPAELDPVSPELSVTASSGDPGSDSDGPVAATGDSSTLAGDTLDFTPYYGPGETYGNGYPDGTQTITLTYTNTGSAPVPFATQAVTLTEPPGSAAAQDPPFTLGGAEPGACAGPLAAGSSCTATVSFDSGSCSQDYADQLRLVSGDLVTHAATPAGQSVLGLTAFCDFFEEVSGPRSGGPPADGTAGPGCLAAPAGLALTAAAADTDNQTAPLADAGSAEDGRPYVAWTTVQAPQDEGTVQMVFADANGTDCQLRLANPARLKLADPLPAGAPPACSQGEELDDPGPSSPPSSLPPTSSGVTRGGRVTPVTTAASSPPAQCTAYVLVDPGAIAPDSAFLGTESPPLDEPDVYLSAYLSMQGVRHVIVARHDESGSGNFAASPSAVASVSGSDAELPGATEPSVSANGRYVAFAAPVPAGDQGQQVAAGASQVWLHDTDKTGNRSYHPGATTLVSCLPRSRSGPCAEAANADSPSVSGDGQQVAFATTAAVVPRNGYPGTGTDAFSMSGDVSADQVYLRSVADRSTVLISRPYKGKKSGGNAPSYAPQISQDASTVGYASQATNLTGATVPAGTQNLYLRLATASAATEIASRSGASLPAGAVLGVPSIDAHGRLVTFPARGVLESGDTAGLASVYAFTRLPRLSSAPGSARFGRVLIDSGTHSTTVAVTDSGPGPGTVTGVTVSGPFLVPGDQCAGVTLQQGSRCTVTITFAPSAAGQAAGTLTVTTQDDDEPPVDASVPAAATVPKPRLALSPGVASAGDTSQVLGTNFPPDQKITLTWKPGLGSAVATSTVAGGFGADMVIFPDDVLGPRTLIATGSHGVLATAPFLVQEGSQEPPFTASPVP